MLKLVFTYSSHSVILILQNSNKMTLTNILIWISFVNKINIIFQFDNYLTKIIEYFFKIGDNKSILL